jgi:hypothetical protein
MSTAKVEVREPQVVGAVLYRVGPDRLEGVWTASTEGPGRQGVEIAERVDGASGDVPGRYHVCIWTHDKLPPERRFFEGTLAVTLLAGGGASGVDSLAFSWTEEGAANPGFEGIGLHRRGSAELSASFWPVTVVQ